MFTFGPALRRAPGELLDPRESEEEEEEEGGEEGEEEAANYGQPGYSKNDEKFNQEMMDTDQQVSE